MMPEQTIQAHLDLKGNILHPIHWGTFNLGFHPWDEPMKRISLAALKNNVRLTTPIVGQSVIYPAQLPNEHWWQLQPAKIADAHHR